MVNIKHYLMIEAPVERVYRAITEEECLRAWWTPESKAKPEKGAILEFTFGKAYHDKMEVIELVVNKRVVWKCMEGDPEWRGTEFLFELEGKSGRTALRFSHTGWNAETDFYASCNFHWGYYMQSLKKYCETGIGTPFGS